MATVSKFPQKPTVASVDALVDENGSRIDVPDGSELKVAGEHDDVVAATSPTNWWLYGLVALAIVIAIILALQVFNGAPGSEVQSGTPTAAPVVEPVAPTTP
jgi:hypothetical protein